MKSYYHHRIIIIKYVVFNMFFFYRISTNRIIIPQDNDLEHMHFNKKHHFIYVIKQSRTQLIRFVHLIHVLSILECYVLLGWHWGFFCADSSVYDFIVYLNISLILLISLFGKRVWLDCTNKNIQQIKITKDYIEQTSLISTIMITWAMHYNDLFGAWHLSELSMNYPPMINTIMSTI